MEIIKLGMKKMTGDVCLKRERVGDLNAQWLSSLWSLPKWEEEREIVWVRPINLHRCISMVEEDCYPSLSPDRYLFQCKHYSVSTPSVTPWPPASCLGPLIPIPSLVLVPNSVPSATTEGLEQAPLPVLWARKPVPLHSQMSKLSS